MQEQMRKQPVDDRARGEEIHRHLLDFLRILARDVVRRLADEQNNKSR